MEFEFGEAIAGKRTCNYHRGGNKETDDKTVPKVQAETGRAPSSRYVSECESTGERKNEVEKISPFGVKTDFSAHTSGNNAMAVTVASKIQITN